MFGLEAGVHLFTPAQFFEVDMKKVFINALIKFLSNLVSVKFLAFIVVSVFKYYQLVDDYVFLTVVCVFIGANIGQHVLENKSGQNSVPPAVNRRPFSPTENIESTNRD